MSDLHGKRLFVVGGETAQGRALAVALAERGADIAIASLTSSTEAEFAINSALNELWALDRKGVALAIDASDAAALRDAVARAERDLGRLAAAATFEGAAVALDALRAALPERVVIVIPMESLAEEALALVVSQL